MSCSVTRWPTAVRLDFLRRLEEDAFEAVLVYVKGNEYMVDSDGVLESWIEEQQPRTRDLWLNAVNDVTRAQFISCRMGGAFDGIH